MMMQRSIELLRYATATPPPTSLNKGLTPEDFGDELIRQQVESISLAIEGSSAEPRSKKRKLESPLSEPLQWIWTKLRGQVGDINEEDDLETKILLVSPATRSPSTVTDVLQPGLPPKG